MGEAKRRGTFEERRRCAIEAEKILTRCYPMKLKRDAFIAANGGNSVDAAVVLLKMIQDQQNQKEQNASTDSSTTVG